MTAKPRRCAVYTRKSTDEGLDQTFNSLDAQREASLAYIASQRGEGWRPIATHYDDGGFSGGNMERPALQRLLSDIAAGLVDVVVVYKVDRLTRSLSDFAKIVERFERHGVSFVSVTQQFNTTTSMGRLTLNVLLSFAQFEREVTGERIRDKIAASKRKGMWMGGTVPLGYEAKDRSLVVNPQEAKLVRLIFQRYTQLKSVHALKAWLDAQDYRSKRRTSRTGKVSGGAKFSRGALYMLLQNLIYLGEIVHKGQPHKGTHTAIIGPALWKRAQALLVENRNGNATRAWAKEPSLLTGLVFDHHGTRLTPSHACKGSRRYRYYVSGPTTRGGGRGLRIPAHDLERPVIGALLRLLRDKVELVKTMATFRLDQSQQAHISRSAEALARAWEEMTISDRLAMLTRMVSKIVVDEREVSITIARRGLLEALAARDPELDIPPTSTQSPDRRPYQISVKASLQRCGGERRVIFPAGVAATAAPQPNAALIKAVARAHVWREMLLSGKARSLDDIATAAEVSSRYVREIIHLSYISPGVAKTILTGEQPPELTLDTSTAEIPISWPEAASVRN
jgi:DNA invertase Pin-like site-specific DNA recombinase